MDFVNRSLYPPWECAVELKKSGCAFWAIRLFYKFISGLLATIYDQKDGVNQYRKGITATSAEALIKRNP